MLGLAGGGELEVSGARIVPQSALGILAGAIAQICPKPRSAGRSPALLDQFQDGVIRKENRGAQYVGLEQDHQHRKLLGRGQNPVAKRCTG